MTDSSTLDLDRELKQSRIETDRNIGELTSNVKVLAIRMDGVATSLEKLTIELVRNTEKTQSLIEKQIRTDGDVKELRDRQQAQQVQIAELKGIESSNTIKIEERQKTTDAIATRDQPWHLFVAGIVSSAALYFLYQFISHAWPQTLK